MVLSKYFVLPLSGAEVSNISKDGLKGLDGGSIVAGSEYQVEESSVYVGVHIEVWSAGDLERFFTGVSKEKNNC